MIRWKEFLSVVRGRVFLVVLAEMVFLDRLKYLMQKMFLLFSLLPSQTTLFPRQSTFHLRARLIMRALNGPRCGRSPVRAAACAVSM